MSQAVMPSNLTTDLSPVASSPRFLLNGSEIDGASVRIAPLTSAFVKISKSNFLSFSIPGKLINVNALNVHSIPENALAFISCDPDSYTGYLDPSTVVAFALAGAGSSKTFPQAIILYSEQSNHCNFTITGNSPVTAFFTTVDPMLATSIADLQLSESSMGETTIVPDLNSFTSANSSSGVGVGKPNDGDGPSPTTAVAMIILYSITGIITALFVIIILTGAVRAHRHPERYGARAGTAGRAAQSRAKGIARAMLTTLPIVKFGDQDDTTPKPPAAGRDIEMNDPAALPTSAENESHNESAGTANQVPVTGAEAVAISNTESEKTEHEHEVHSTEAQTVAGAGNNADGTQEDGSLGCSICTEDFTRGEEVRVLPCNHKFHPACVDPWLLNVSGTCPLCRIDLRPAQSTEEGGSALAPPLENSADVANDFSPARNGSIPSLIHMRNSSASGEERIAALRRLRNATRQSEGAEGEQAEQRQGVTSRLRDRFRVRTTRAREPSVQEEGIVVNSNTAAAPAPTDLRPLREVYRLGRR